MLPETRGQFDCLHEAPLPFNSKEMRIWETNSIGWEGESSEPEMRAVFLNISRINHSCLPNAEIIQNKTSKRMEVHSHHDVRAGEEITIDYVPESQYQTAAERNASLKSLYGFTCSCRACIDPDFSPLSDKRRLLLKEIWCCEFEGRRPAPDFSPKALKTDGRPSRAPVLGDVSSATEEEYRKNVWRPGTERVWRRYAKTLYDEGHRGLILLDSLACYTSTALRPFHNRMGPARKAKSAIPELSRLVHLTYATSTLLKTIKFKTDPESKQIDLNVDHLMRMSNVVAKMTKDECTLFIDETMTKEPNPFYARHW